MVAQLCNNAKNPLNCALYTGSLRYVSYISVKQFGKWKHELGNQVQGLPQNPWSPMFLAQCCQRNTNNRFLRAVLFCQAWPYVFFCLISTHRPFLDLQSHWPLREEPGQPANCDPRGGALYWEKSSQKSEGDWDPWWIMRAFPPSSACHFLVGSSAPLPCQWVLPGRAPPKSNSQGSAAKQSK